MHPTEAATPAALPAPTLYGIAGQPPEIPRLFDLAGECYSYDLNDSESRGRDRATVDVSVHASFNPHPGLGEREASVYISSGGPLSLHLDCRPATARAFAQALIEAADKADAFNREHDLPYVLEREEQLRADEERERDMELDRMRECEERDEDYAPLAVSGQQLAGIEEGMRIGLPCPEWAVELLGPGPVAPVAWPRALRVPAAPPVVLRWFDVVEPHEHGKYLIALPESVVTTTALAIVDDFGRLVRTVEALQ